MAMDTYYYDVSHQGLGKFQRIKGPNQYVVGQRAAAKEQQWAEQ